MDQIKVENLYKIFGKNPQQAYKLVQKGVSKDEILKKTGCTIGVNNASFNVKKGEFFVIMGLSGSGKSTLVRCINRLIEPTRGDVVIDDQNVTKLNSKDLRELRKRKISMVFQHFGLLPHRNVLENVVFGLEIQGISRSERYEKAENAIQLVGLDGYQKSAVSNLSGGMQQRVGLARAIAADTELILMDEAFSALDPLIRTNMQDELLELQSRMHKTILFITHDLDEALKLGDRIAIMKDGLIEQIDTPEQILISPASQYIENFVENVDRSKIITAGTIMHRPDVVATHKDGPKSALRHMRQSGLSTLYVVDAQRALAGYIKIDDAVEASKNHVTSLEPILNKDVPTTSADTPLIDLLNIASETTRPIVVTNDSDHIKGIVTRTGILAALAGESLENEN
ncbi:MAG: glycine betaine/L-proline ABC transporter ATP-binding protein [Sedimentisphaeraceae bacterium JB056]